MSSGHEGFSSQMPGGSPSTQMSDAAVQTATENQEICGAANCQRFDSHRPGCHLSPETRARLPTSPMVAFRAERETDTKERATGISDGETGKS